jgi:hypothetical protein
LWRKKRATSRGSARSFSAEKLALQDDKPVVYRDLNFL